MPVRDLHVLVRVGDRRRTRWLRSLLLSVLSSGPEVDDEHWHVVSVHRGRVVAERRFETEKGAQRARSRFVELVSNMRDGDYEAADLQALLDRA
jgi:hypothetical protein